MKSLAPDALQALLLGTGELALLDVREACRFNDAHLNLARLAPLSTLELQIGAFVPRLTTEILVYDDADATDGLAARAAALLGRLGYTRVRRLAGGLNAWRTEGLAVIDGYATLVKAFGDLARQNYGTPTLSLADFEQRRRAGRPTTLIDARPRDEFGFLSIEGARNYPGTELAMRALPAQGPDHLWVVNCFSRTRGIIGATTLRLLARDEHTAFLEDGVMAWGLRGGAVVQNASPVDDIPAEAPGVLRALSDWLITHHGLSVIDADRLAQHQGEEDRSLYLFDLRPSNAPAAPAGVRRVAGGQLLMHFENFVGTRNARIVLIDEPHRLRAAVTAFWLAQLNQAEVHVLAGELPALAEAAPAQPADDADPGLLPDELAQRISRGEVELVDVGPSIDYENGHLPLARFLLPASLELLEPVLAAGRTVVFSSPDGAAARLAARDARLRWPASAFAWLRGGTSAWAAEDRPLEAAYAPEQLLTPFDDDWGSVMRVFGPRRDEAWAAYLVWERGLAHRVIADPTVNFRFFDAVSGREAVPMTRSLVRRRASCVRTDPTPPAAPMTRMASPSPPPSVTPRRSKSSSHPVSDVSGSAAA
jgi:rhodanese-related sulfurtransferase